MTMELEITQELQSRIASIAARSSRSVSEVVAEALENGRSLDWQEWFLDKVAQGIAAADRAEFASSADLERVRNKYRPA